MKNTFLFIFIAVFTACDSPSSIAEWQTKEALTANLPHEFGLEKDINETALQIRLLGSQEVFPAQLLDKRTVVFLPYVNIPANSKLCLEPVSTPFEKVFSLTENGKELIISRDGTELLNYALETRMPADSLPAYYQRSGFIHPLKTIEGRTITDDFPRGHTHQHGVFNAYVNTTFKGEKIDFWNQQQETGTVRHVELLDHGAGPVFSWFKNALEHLAFVDGDTIVALKEIWEMRLFPLGDAYLIDWDITHQAVKDSLHLNEYHYGGAAFRGNTMWNAEGFELENGFYDSLVFVLTNEGFDHQNGNHSRPLWTAMYGETENGKAGIAIMGHNTNYRHPQPVRIHPSMPYFCFAPMALGAFDLVPGEAYNSRYRLLVYDGEPDKAMINAVQANFVNSPQ